MKRIIICIFSLFVVLCSTYAVKAIEIMPLAGYWHPINVYLPANFGKTSTGQATKWSSGDTYARVCITETNPGYITGINMWVEDAATGSNVTGTTKHAGYAGRCYELPYNNVAAVHGKNLKLTLNLSMNQPVGVSVRGNWSPDMPN